MTVSPRVKLLVGLATATALLGSAVLAHGLRLASEGTDLEILARYARAALDGEIPYRDFFFEYPPGALVAIVGPGLGSPTVHAYATRFAVGMLIVLGLTVLTCAGVLAACRGTRDQLLRTLGLVALSPLLLGPIALKRFDALPALLTVVALLLVVRRSFVPSAFVLGIATAVKLYPLVLLPPVVVAALGRSRRAAVEATVSFVAGCAVLVLPFLVVSPGGVEESVRSQLDRHLQFESSLASVALLGNAVAGVSVGLVSEAHSYALGGSRGTLLGVLTTVALLAGLALVWWRLPRLVLTGDGLVLAFAASIAVVVAFARILSPQYLLWLVPLVPLVRGSVGRLATGLLAGACVLTNIWFPGPYGEVVSSLDRGSILLLSGRNILLVALAAVLVASAWRRPRGEAE